MSEKEKPNNAGPKIGCFSSLFFIALATYFFNVANSYSQWGGYSEMFTGLFLGAIGVIIGIIALVGFSKNSSGPDQEK